MATVFRLASRADPLSTSSGSQVDGDRRPATSALLIVHEEPFANAHDQRVDAQRSRLIAEDDVRKTRLAGDLEPR